jgi:uncharacterized protein YndB with AHSA1/START domain
MSQQTTETAPIHKSVRVDVSVEKAFHVFIEEIGTWWPNKTHSVGQARCEDVVIETRLGGRVYERMEGGAEADWGEVLAWEPPHRIAFSWHPGRGPETAQEVAVRFSPEGNGARVELEHRGWEALSERVAEIRPHYVPGWDEVLQSFIAAAER